MRDGKVCYQAIKSQQVRAFSCVLLADLMALLSYFPSINLSEGRGKKKALLTCHMNALNIMLGAIFNHFNLQSLYILCQ